MRRREFIGFIGGVAAAWSLDAHAQQPKRIGWLEQGQPGDPAAQTRIAAVRQGLEQLGWVVGRNLQIDYRWGVVSFEMAQRLGEELLSLSPDVVLSVGSPGVKALQQATTSVPIVFIFVAEPVDQGFVQSLAHPGGNITAKVKHIAYVFSPKAAPYAHFYYESAQAAGEKIGVQTDINPVNEPADIEPILSHLGADGGVIFNADAFINNNLKLEIDLAARYRVPAVYGGGSGGAKAGGLISYNLDVPAQVRQIAPYFDRILRGEKPGDLPVQLPTQFQYVINLKTANALGLAVPMTMQMTADEVIE